MVGSSLASAAVYFETQLREAGGWQVVRVIGEVDLATLPQFRQAVLAGESAASAMGRGLAIDLTHCEFIDSPGLGVTLGGYRRTLSAGHRFVVICPGVRIRTIFERCRLDEILDLYAALPDP